MSMIELIAWIIKQVAVGTRTDWYLNMIDEIPVQFISIDY